MNFPKKIAYQQSVVMARSVYLAASLFLKNCGDETIKQACECDYNGDVLKKG